MNANIFFQGLREGVAWLVDYGHFPLSGPRRRSSQLRIERLEDRLTPSITLNVTNNFGLDPTQYGAWIVGEAGAGGTNLTVLTSGSTFQKAATTISSAQELSGNTVTITTNGAHGLSNGETVFITGVAEPRYNGIFTVANPISANSFSYFNPITALPNSSGGTANTSSVISPPANIAASPIGATWSSSTNAVTITTKAPHGLTVQETVFIAGVGVAGYNGTFTVTTTPSPTTFTYNMTASLAASGGGNVRALSVPVINVANLPSITFDNTIPPSGRLTVFVSHLSTPPQRLAVMGTGISAPPTPPFSPGQTNFAPPNDIVEFTYIAGGNSTFNLSAVNGFGVPLTLQASMAPTNPGIVGVTQVTQSPTSSSFNRAAIGDAFIAFMQNDPQGTDFGELIYNSQVPTSTGAIYETPPLVAGQYYVIADPSDWLANQPATAASDPLADYWDTTLNAFFKDGNSLSVNISSNPAAPNIYSGTCSGGTYSLSNGKNTYNFTNPGPGLPGAQYVFGQKLPTPAPDQGLLQDNIWQALSRGVALDGVSTTSTTKSTAHRHRSLGETSRVSTTPYTNGESTTFWNNFNNWYGLNAHAGVYNTYAKFLHYSTLAGTDSRAGGTPILINNQAYGFSEDETPNGPYTGGPVPAKFDGTIPDGATLTLTIDPWEAQPPSHPGVYNPANSTFYLKNSDGSGPADLSFQLGPGGQNPAWVPIAGDWNADGVDTVGLYNPATSIFYLANQTGIAEFTFQFGVAHPNPTPSNPAWIPLAGDWNGDGTTTIGLYDPMTATFYLRNSNSAGKADLTFTFGNANAGWIPLAGNWTGTTTTTIGAYDPTQANFYLRNTNTAGNPDNTFNYGPSNAGFAPIMGDWDGNGATTAGLYNSLSATFYLRNFNSAGPADITFSYGPASQGFVALTGSWNGASLKAAGSLPANTGIAAPLTQDELDPIVAEAINRFARTGLPSDLVLALASVPVSIADLENNELGLAIGDLVSLQRGDSIFIDRTAAGYGWFVDPTPGQDEEFGYNDVSPAAGRMDLLSAVSHEMGHMLGLAHVDELRYPSHVMVNKLATGVRRVPSMTDVDVMFAGPLYRQWN